MSRCWLFALLVAVPLAAKAQAPNAGALAQRSRDALTPIARIVGQWAGEARVVEGPGEPIRVRQSEDVAFGAANTVLLIRGTGRNPQTDAINFEAVAMLWYDPQHGKMRMRSHRDGNTIEPEVEVRTDTLIWSFAMPAGRVRYVIALSDSTWHEVGTFERPGAPPMPILDMRLRRAR
jgi:hypothetical protein